ncbi:MAG TPA: hypothetical protein VJ892_03490, partial [Candidatus Absconditabacterales bacterium]|nr:hypothetical protein [Candidatus Absconditabacterales bacterium]
MFKKILLFIIVPVALYFIGIVAINAINYQVNSSMSPDYYSIVHFNQNGNDFEGLFLLNGDVTQNSGEVISFSGVEKTCFKQIKGYYYNSQRGARWRPLDQDSLIYLQSINASYSGLNMEGGFRTSCSGEDEGNVYGQITHTYKGNTFKLLAGVDYNFDDGKYINHYSGNLNYVNIQDSFSMNGYVYDTWGGIGKLTSNINLVEGDYSITGAVSSGTIVNLTGNLTVMSSGYEGEISLSDIDIVVSGLDWDGIIIPPTVVDPQGSSGISDTGVLLFTTQVGASGTSLIASGGYFNISLYVSGYDVGGS